MSTAARTTPRVALPPALQAVRTQLGERWRAMAPRERQALTVALWLVGGFLVWTLSVQPSLRTLREAPIQLNQLDAQLQQMNRLAVDGRELRSTTPVPPAQAAAALKSATDRLGDRARLSVQGERATLTLTGVDSAALSTWLGEARRAARTRPVEAQLTRTPQGYAGSIIVAFSGTSP